MEIGIRPEHFTSVVPNAMAPAAQGGDGVRFEGELMALSPPPRTSGGREEYRELTWQRISAE